jgi:hypothetical protein
MIDLRQTHIEEFNMLLILLVVSYLYLILNETLSVCFQQTDILYKIPGELLDNVMDVTHIKTIGYKFSILSNKYFY